MAKLTQKQIAAVRDAHQALDRLALLPPGAGDTAEAREARARRTALEESFPEAFERPAESPIEIARA